ncbi:MAG TPA: hypothetical protein VIV12_01260, partial [Streptosporangiaceae bacterium]
RHHEVTVDSLVRLQALISELRRIGRMRQVRDYVWWSAQDSADYANGQLSEALRQRHAGELAGLGRLATSSGTAVSQSPQQASSIR